MVRKATKQLAKEAIVVAAMAAVATKAVGWALLLSRDSAGGAQQLLVPGKGQDSVPVCQPISEIATRLVIAHN
jgi:hypothetical protein